MKIECDNLKKEWRQFQQEKKSFLRLEYFTHLLLIKLISQLCCNEQRDDMLSYVYELGHCGLFFLILSFINCIHLIVYRKLPKTGLKLTDLGCEI